MIFSRRIVHWVCPNCSTTVNKPFVPNESEYHNCSGMGMLVVPMVQEGQKVKITANEREDYIGKSDVQTDATGRPIMNVTVEREDGQDCVVYAPVAEVKGRSV